MKATIYKAGNRIITTGTATLSELKYCMGDLLGMDAVEINGENVSFEKVKVLG